MIKLLSTIGISSLIFVPTAFAGEEPMSVGALVVNEGEANSYQSCLSSFNAVTDAISLFSNPDVPMPSVSAHEVCTVATSQDVVQALQEELRNSQSTLPPGFGSGSENTPAEWFEKIKNFCTTEAKKIKVGIEVTPEPHIIAKYEIYNGRFPESISLFGGGRASAGIYAKQEIGDDGDFSGGIYGEIGIGSNGFLRAELNSDGDTRLLFGIGIGF